VKSVFNLSVWWPFFVKECDSLDEDLIKRSRNFVNAQELRYLQPLPLQDGVADNVGSADLPVPKKLRNLLQGELYRWKAWRTTGQSQERVSADNKSCSCCYDVNMLQTQQAGAWPTGLATQSARLCTQLGED